MTAKTILATVPMTPKAIVEMQIGTVMGALRASSAGDAYVPGQLGGIYGQREVLLERTPLTVVKLRNVAGA